MKKVTLILLALSFSFVGFAQKKGKDDKAPVMAPVPSPSIDNTLLKSYQRALDYGDLEAAKNVVYQLIAKDSGNAWLDTLVQLYFSMGAYAQCVLSANEYLAKHSGDEAVLELVAASDYSLKRYKEALDDYEKLFKKSQSSYHAYQIAINQYMLKRYGECDGTIQFILADKQNEKQTLLINMPSGGSQRVPIRAAAWNLRGVVLRDISKADDAKTCFEESLKVYPDFVLPKGNLESMAVKPTETAQPVKTSPAPKKK